MKLRNFSVLFLLGGAVFFIACEGDRIVCECEEDMGPAGPKGDKGDPGTPGAAGGDKGDKGDPAPGDPRCDVSNGINALPGVSNDITGTADDDIICGNQYINNISAGDGDDTVYGGAGNDILDGGPGADTLTGGAGADTFVIRHSSKSAKDNITDFNASQNDIIHFIGFPEGSTLAGSGRTVTVGSDELFDVRDDAAANTIRNTPALYEFRD